MASLSESDRKVLNDWRRLTPEQKRVLLDLLSALEAEQAAKTEARRDA